jgi:hypothetical protein
MKKQIKRLSPHQNGKVFGVLMGLSSLVFVIPMFIGASLMPMPAGPHGDAMMMPPTFMVLLFPLLYLVMGYIMTAIACVVYNFAYKYIGGIEYETSDGEA